MPAIPRQVKVVKSVFTPRRKHDSILHFHGEEELENDGNLERLSIPTLPTKGKLGRNAVNITEPLPHDHDSSHVTMISL